MRTTWEQLQHWLKAPEGTKFEYGLVGGSAFVRQYPHRLELTGPGGIPPHSMMLHHREFITSAG